MYFFEPIVRLFANSLLEYVCFFIIRWHNFVRHYLIAKIFAKLFLQHNLYHEIACDVV